MEKSNIEKWDESVMKDGCITQEQITRKIKPWAGIVKPNIIMKPSIGRIVHFQLNEDDREKLNNYQSTAPAIITAVWGDECVNLKVLLDGETNIWVTSAMKGTGENQWDWPVIV